MSGSDELVEAYKRTNIGTVPGRIRPLDNVATNYREEIKKT